MLWRTVKVDYGTLLRMVVVIVKVNYVTLLGMIMENFRDVVENCQS
jgi:hypothetical protein